MANKKKKFFGIFAAAIFALSLVSCNGITNPSNNPGTTPGSGKSEQKIIEAETAIDGSTLKSNDFAYITYSLAEYKNQTVTIELSADMKVINSGSEKVTLMWQTTTTNYPVIVSGEFAAGESLRHCHHDNRNCHLLKLRLEIHQFFIFLQTEQNLQN